MLLSSHQSVLRSLLFELLSSFSAPSLFISYVFIMQSSLCPALLPISYLFNQPLFAQFLDLYSSFYTAYFNFAL